MTDIAFHFNAPDRVAYVCRLLRKAVGSGAKVVVTGAPTTLRQLDADLWSLGPTDFVPHCEMGADPHVVAATPVILAASAELAPHRQVLVNLGQHLPAGFEQFERVIEVVTLDEEDRQLARRRWKQYADLGFNIVRHDLALKANTP